MKTSIQYLTLLLAIYLLLPTNAYASLIKFNMRCSEDSLSVEEAVERVEWAVKCNLITPEDRFDALFTGSSGERRPRPMYPIVTNGDLSHVWIAPKDRNAPCITPSGYVVMGFCTASCYTPDQVVLFPEGFVPIKEARELALPEVVTLSDNATLENPELKVTPVESYTEEIRNTWHKILNFKTQSGGDLKVTTNHPLVDGRGRIRSADSMKVGDALVHYLNGKDPIVAISEARYFGKVYNITPKVDSLLSQVVIAEGYLNGSAYYQNDGVNYLNRKILRQTLPEELLQ